MNGSAVPAAEAPATQGESVVIRARPTGFTNDLTAIAGRALRAAIRAPEEIIPALMIPTFFFVVNIGALQDLTERFAQGLDYKAFQLPTAIVFAVTGVSRAGALVNDINSGYFDRLLVTPVKRLTLLLGLMCADLALVIGLCLPVLALGLAVGVRFTTGPLGIVVFVLMGGFWGLAFTGFPYAIALKTGSAAAVNSSFLLFFPFAFLTTSTVPREALTGWLGQVADFNPMTYLLAAQRSLVSQGWEPTTLAKGWACIAGLGVVSMSLAFSALRGRLRKG